MSRPITHIIVCYCLNDPLEMEAHRLYILQKQEKLFEELYDQQHPQDVPADEYAEAVVDDVSIRTLPVNN